MIRSRPRWWKLVDALDEWFHRRGFGTVHAEHRRWLRRTVTPWWGWVALPVCAYREKNLTGQTLYDFGVGTNVTTANTENSGPLVVKWHRTHLR